MLVFLLHRPFGSARIDDIAGFVYIKILGLLQFDMKFTGLPNTLLKI
jgi:hypothetical protein